MNPFVNIPEKEILYRSSHFFVIKDRFPVSPGHCLIIASRETPDYFSLGDEEKADLPKVIDSTRSLIEKQYKVDGYNIGFNCGNAAGQTVFHFHCHVIPRYSGDMGDPRGGIRHCVQGKGYY